MAENGNGFVVRFPSDYDAQSEFETPSRGYLGGVIVEFEDGHRYQLFFYDPIRLRQDLEAESASGRPYLAEHGMVVLPEVTTAGIREAVARLVREGFFRHVKPLDNAEAFRPALTGSS